MLEKIKKLKIGLFKDLLLVLGLFLLCFNVSCVKSHNENYLEIAKETTKSNENFLFASNASIPGRIYMTFSKDTFKTCINTVTSFYNKYNTCSHCGDFVENPKRWNFEQTNNPKIGDLVIYHDPKTNRAYHAAIIVNIKNGKYYINHAVKKNYYKNVELKTKANLTFYKYLKCN